MCKPCGEGEAGGKVAGMSRSSCFIQCSDFETQPSIHPQPTLVSCSCCSLSQLSLAAGLSPPNSSSVAPSQAWSSWNRSSIGRILRSKAFWVGNSCQRQAVDRVSVCLCGCAGGHVVREIRWFKSRINGKTKAHYWTAVRVIRQLVYVITWIRVQFGNNCMSYRQSNCTSDSECNLCLLWVQLFPNCTRIHVIAC